MKKFWQITTRTRKGQSILEYAILVVTVAAAFMAMNVYFNRAVNSRIHDLNTEIDPPIVVR